MSCTVALFVVTAAAVVVVGGGGGGAVVGAAAAATATAAALITAVTVQVKCPQHQSYQVSPFVSIVAEMP